MVAVNHSNGVCKVPANVQRRFESHIYILHICPLIKIVLMEDSLHHLKCLTFQRTVNNEIKPYIISPRKFNSSPLKRFLPNRKVVWQPPFFSGQLSNFGRGTIKFANKNPRKGRFAPKICSFVYLSTTNTRWHEMSRFKWLVCVHSLIPVCPKMLGYFSVSF